MASIALVLISAVTSALTLGFFSLDKVEMEVLKLSGTDKEVRARMMRVWHGVGLPLSYLGRPWEDWGGGANSI